jgi:hypothetical protein
LGNDDEPFEESFFSDEEESKGEKTSKKEKGTTLSTGNNKKLIDAFIPDEEFKANYSAGVLKRQSTLSLKTSFHLVNLVLMGMCQVFKDIEKKNEDSAKFNKNSTLQEQKLVTRTHKCNMIKFMHTYSDYCIYDLSGANSRIEILEFAPAIFKGIRRRFGVSEDHLFQSFMPIHNVQAIYNFFTGTGKSSSFFFFSDNKAYVLKTLKESEKKLLLENGILENYYNYVMSNKETLLSKYYGVY